MAKGVLQRGLSGVTGAYWAVSEAYWGVAEANWGGWVCGGGTLTIS